MVESAEKQTLNFQADVSKVLDLVIHSLYSNKEIFLRELISNASDANDKLRFAALSDNSLYGEGGDSDLKIKITVDKNARTLTVSDNGIGMTRQEAVDHLGTVAKSGTSEFLSQLSKDQLKDSNLIGQFGVGFYSAFIVADRVTVRSRKAGTAASEAIQWQSDGVSGFSVETANKATRGTDVILHLREGMDEFLDDFRIRNIITKYSDHICWPILMDREIEEKEGEKKIETETINKATALWTLPKSQIKDEEYKEFYKHVAHDFRDPMLWIHNKVEGKQNYTSLLYIPESAIADMWNPDTRHGLKLYVQRVFIMDEADKFLPRFLRFVKGVIDCNDLPLNVSRELLQDNKTVDTIRAALSKRVLSTLEKLAQDEPEKYQKFWEAFGQVIKEGPIEDFQNRDAIVNLLRFSSTHTDDAKQTISLKDYVSRMKPEQKKIYYITAENFNTAKHSPHLEIFRKKGIEVLLLTERIDEWLVGHLSEFEGKHLQSVMKGKLDLEEIEQKDEATKEEEKKVEEQFTPFVEHVKKVLGENRVKDVRITYRLTDSPACLVGDEYELSRQMQKILKAAGQNFPGGKPILEINPHHPLVERLKNEADEKRFEEWANILLDQAVLAEGGELEDAPQFVERLNKMLLALMQ